MRYMTVVHRVSPTFAVTAYIRAGARAIVTKHYVSSGSNYACEYLDGQTCEPLFDESPTRDAVERAAFDGEEAVRAVLAEKYPAQSPLETGG
jgi:hypothetical protein